MFENPYAFWLFLSLPFIALIFIYDNISLKKRSKIIAGNNIQQVIPYYSEGQKWIRFVLYMIAFGLMIVGIARPRWGVETIDAKTKGRDILILLDISLSMNTNDVIPSRFESAKRSIMELLDSENQDRIGLMVFSGDSELVSPVTHDYAAVSFFLDSIYPGMMSKSGTNIGNALINAIEAFDDEGVSHKMILLITDGEDLEGNIQDALTKVKESEIKVFTAGVGTSNGEPIPVRNAKGEVESYVKDPENKHVISRLDEKTLKYIGESANGKYLGTINSKGSLKRAVDYIRGLVATKDQDKLTYEQKKERYDIFMIPALILFCIGFILDQGRLFRLQDSKLAWLFNKKFVIFVLIFNLLFIINNKGFSQSDNSNDVSHTQKMLNLSRPNGGFWGNIDFKNGKFKQALENYLSALRFSKGNDKAKLNYNIGNSYYKLNDLNKAEQNFENAAAYATDDLLKAKIFYNQGLVEFKKQNYDLAFELFKKAIQFNDKDDDARYNYEVCKILKENAKKDSQNKDQQKDKKQNQEQQNKQNQSKEQKMKNEETQKLLKALDEKEKKENSEKRQADQNSQPNQSRTRYW